MCAGGVAHSLTNWKLLNFDHIIIVIFIGCCLPSSC